MDDKNLSFTGDPLTGYETRGPYSCGSCQHRLNAKSDLCIHPLLVSNPYLKEQLVQIENNPEYPQGIRVDLEHGCCEYVRSNKEISLLVLRHGETKLNADKKFRSLRNVPLDEHGIEEAQEAAQFLKNFPIKKIVCSTLDRAYHTALMVAEVLDVPVIKDASLLPWNLGELSGTSRKENADVLKYYIEHPNEAIPDGESLNTFRQTMFDVFDKYVEESSWDNLILIVGHTSTITTLNQWADENYTGQPETDDESVEPGGVVALLSDTDKDEFQVKPIWGVPKKADFGS